MVKKIVHIADIHIRNYKNMDATIDLLKDFIKECKEIASEMESKKDLRIVIAGDLVESKTELSPECYQTTVWFLSELDKICPVIVCAGNHDINEQNLDRLDPLSVIFGACKFKQVRYIDQKCDYQSNVVNDDNVQWCLYSVFDSLSRPTALNDKDTVDEGVTRIGLYHGEIKGAKNDSDYVFEFGVPVDYFEGLDFALLGHIHKRQCLKYNGIPLVYPGSLIQHDFGETISGHGYLLWDVEERTYTAHDLKNDKFGFYEFRIENEDSIDEDKEELINL